MEDVITAYKQNLLSQTQFLIFNDRVNNFSYNEIQQRYCLSGENKISKCLIRTALCLYWDKGMKGGTDPYLSLLDQQVFCI